MVKENWSHFYGHEQVSAEMAEAILKRLRYDRKTVKDVMELVASHGYVFNRTEKYVRRRLNQLGEEQLMRLIDLERGDVLSQAEHVREERAKAIDAFRELVQTVVEKEGVLKRKELAIDGRDVLELGVPRDRKWAGCWMKSWTGCWKGTWRIAGRHCWKRQRNGRKAEESVRILPLFSNLSNLDGQCGDRQYRKESLPESRRTVPRQEEHLRPLYQQENMRIRFDRPMQELKFRKKASCSLCLEGIR